MGKIEELSERYGQHIATPWQRTVAGSQRVIVVVYDTRCATAARRIE